MTSKISYCLPRDIAKCLACSILLCIPSNNAPCTAGKWCPLHAEHHRVVLVEHYCSMRRKLCNICLRRKYLRCMGRFGIHASLQQRKTRKMYFLLFLRSILCSTVCAVTACSHLNTEHRRWRGLLQIHKGFRDFCASELCDSMLFTHDLYRISS